MSDAGKVWVVDPTDGSTRQVSAEEAQQGFQAGKLNLPKSGDVQMTAPDGSVKTGPTSGVAQLLGQGWRLSSKDEVLKSQAENQKTQAFLEGGLSELTFGLSDVAAQQMGVEGLKERRETTAGTVGRALGMGAGVLLAGPVEAAASAAEKSIGMQAAEAALFPMRKLLAAGDAVESAAGKALAGSIENQAVARAAASGIGRAVEGAAFGAGGALSEEALGNPDANAQSLLAAAGAGSLMGAGIGGVAGAGLRALGDGMAAKAYKAGREAQAQSVGARHMTPEEFQAAQEMANGQPFSEEAAKGVKGWLYNAYKKAASVISGGDAADIDKLNSAFGQEVLRNGEKYFDSAGREMGDVMNNMADVQAKSGKEAFGPTRREALDKLLPKGAAGSSVAAAGRALDNVRKQLDAIEANAEAMGYAPVSSHEPSVVERFRKALDGTEERLMKKAGVPIEYTERTRREVPGAFELSGGGVPEEEWQARKAARAVESGNAEAAAANERIGKDVFGAEPVPEVPSLPRTPMVQTPMTVEEIVTKRRDLKDLGEGAFNIPDSFVGDVHEELVRLKRMFDKPGMFGQDVPDDVARNLRDAFRDIRSGLVEHTTDEAVYGGAGALQRGIDAAYAARAKAFDALQEAGLKVYEDASGRQLFDPRSVISYMKNIDRVQGDRAFAALDAWQEANLQYAKELDKYMPAQSLGADARALHAKFAKIRQDVAAHAEVFSAGKRLRAESQKRFGFGGNGGALAGALLGGFSPLGVLGGAAGEAILNPGRAALLRATLGHLVDRFQTHLDARVGRLVTDKAEDLIPDLPVRSRAIAKGTLAMLQAKTPAERREAYDKRVDELAHLSDPTTFGDHASTQLLGLSEHVPAHADAMTRVAANAMSAVRAAVPPALPGTTGDGGAFDAVYAKPRPHDRDILKFAEIDRAAQAPVDAIMDAAERGHVPDHVLRTVEQVYPDVLQAIRTSILNHAGNGRLRPSHAKSMIFNKILGGTVVSSQKLTQMQAVHRMAATPKPQSSGSPKVKSQRSSGLMTATDKLDNIYSK